MLCLSTPFRKKRTRRPGMFIVINRNYRSSEEIIMDFYQGGLFSYDRDECCFIKYLVNIIQSVQLQLKKEQLDINTDFEEFIAAVRNFGEPRCVWVWRELRSHPECEYLQTTSIGSLDFEECKCAECPFGKDKAWQSDSDILNGIKLVRDALARYDSQNGDFIEYNICRFFPHLMKIVGNRHPEYSSILRKHYTAPKLFCEDIETEIGMRRMYYFLDTCGSEPLIQFYQALVCCQERLYFPMQRKFDDDGHSWKPKTGRELWSVAFEVIDLMIESVRILPQLEEQYFGKKSDIDINQLVQALNKHFIPAVQENTTQQGVALKQLARHYYLTNDIGKGDYEQEIINLNERMRKLQSKYHPIGRGKYKALLFQLNDAVELLQTALKNEKAIPRDTAVLLARCVLEDVLETAVLKKNS